MGIDLFAGESVNLAQLWGFRCYICLTLLLRCFQKAKEIKDVFLDYCQVQDEQTKPMCQDWCDMGCRLPCISPGLGFFYIS